MVGPLMAGLAYELGPRYPFWIAATLMGGVSILTRQVRRVNQRAKPAVPRRRLRRWHRRDSEAAPRKPRGPPIGGPWKAVVAGAGFEPATFGL